MSYTGTVSVHLGTLHSKNRAQLNKECCPQGILIFSVSLKNYAKSKCFEYSWSEIPYHLSQLSKISYSSNSMSYKKLETILIPQPGDRATLLSTDFTHFMCWLSCAQPLQGLLMLPALHSVQEGTIWKIISFHLEALVPCNPQRETGSVYSHLVLHMSCCCVT